MFIPKLLLLGKPGMCGYFSCAVDWPETRIPRQIAWEAAALEERWQTIGGEGALAEGQPRMNVCGGSAVVEPCGGAGTAMFPWLIAPFRSRQWSLFSIATNSQIIATQGGIKRCKLWCWCSNMSGFLDSARAEFGTVRASFACSHKSNLFELHP